MKISKVLVANRGEIASRVFRTCRTMGLGTVAVFSDEDSAAPFVREADEAFRLAGSRSADTYLRADLILEAVRRSGADAVHPGYGFLSENADFARACAAAGVVFIGPPADAIDAMGDKLRSKQLMASHGVPVLDSVLLDGEVDAEVAGRVEALGYPVLVKASAGGGGRGMRVVEGPAGLAAAVGSARREAAGAFGDDTVFIERYIIEPRHIEVQVMADAHGNVVSLFERECSIQRRHQKVIEEAPSPAVDQPLRDRLCSAATAAAAAVDYRGAGTVEFVLAPDGAFAFLEMNTRLQVEHPVTELVTGLDLVRLQIEVAQGLPLPDRALRPTVHGHAIEARLYAEDVPSGYLPTTGVAESFDFPDVAGLRVDASIETGSVVSPHYDPMLAKVIAWGETRDEAAGLLAWSLRSARLAGLTTNRDLLVRVLEDPDFRDGTFSTAFLDQKSADMATPLADGSDAERLAIAAAVASSIARRRAARLQTTIPAGWRNNRHRGQRASYESAVGRIDLDYVWTGADALTVTTGQGQTHAVRLGRATPELVDVELDGRRMTIKLDQHASTTTASCASGSLVLTEVPRFPVVESSISLGTLTAPMPGAVRTVVPQVGDVVTAGDPFIVMEAMKMEHTVLAPTTGRVAQILVTPGEQVEAGALLARIADEDAG